MPWEYDPRVFQWTQTESEEIMPTPDYRETYHVHARCAAGPRELAQHYSDACYYAGQCLDFGPSAIFPLPLITLFYALVAIGVDRTIAAWTCAYLNLRVNTVLIDGAGDCVVDRDALLRAMGAQRTPRYHTLNPRSLPAIWEEFLDCYMAGRTSRRSHLLYAGSNGWAWNPNDPAHDRQTLLGSIGLSYPRATSEDCYQRTIIYLRGIREFLRHLTPMERRECVREYREMVAGWPSAQQSVAGWHAFPQVHPHYVGRYGQDRIQVARQAGGLNRVRISAFLTRWRIPVPCGTCGLSGECDCSTLSHTMPGRLTFHPPRGSEATPSDHIIPRYVGLELEVCGIRKGKMGEKVTEAVASWGGEVKGDGSLPEGGFEIALSPARGDKARAQIKEVCAALSEADAFVTRAAGGHVHVDASDLSNAQLATLYSLWYLLEDTVFELCAPNRRSNTYCSPWDAKPRVIVTSPIDPDVEGLSLGTHRLFYSCEPSNRYKSLNLCNLRGDRRTVEFRLFPGTVTEETALRNACIAARIVECAATWSAERLTEVFAYRSNMRLLEEVMGPEGWVLVNPSLAEEAVSCSTLGERCDDDGCSECNPDEPESEEYYGDPDDDYTPFEDVL